MESSRIEDKIRQPALNSTVQIFSISEQQQIMAEEGSCSNKLEEKKTEVPTEDPNHWLLYGLNDNPPWYLTILLGIQHFLAMVGGTITIPFILTPIMCISDSDPIRGTFLSTLIFVSGIVTFIQTSFGVRLPIVQGASFGYLVPTIALIKSKYPECDTLNLSNMTQIQQDDVYLERIREIQGSIAVACVMQVIVSFSGILGLCIAYITPLTIVPTISLIGLALFEAATEKAALHWGIAVMTIGLLVLFSQYLPEVQLPLPHYSKTKGIKFRGSPIFKLFPVLLTIAISWIICMIFTVTDVLKPGSPARTDNQWSIIELSPWFYVPYPFQWGLPTVSLAGVIAMVPGVLVSMIESVGDYYACARLSGAPPPPIHAINRGLGMEGIGCILAGIWGTGTATTSYSQNVAAIWITRVGSRRVTQACAAVMIIVGVLGKLCGLFVTIPAPIVGGTFIVLFSLITAVGFSNLQMVDLKSSRNLFVLGFSIFIGLAIPTWIKNNSTSIQTSIANLDQIIIVLFSTPMFVGGFVGFILDNTIPGTPQERGLLAWHAQLQAPAASDGIINDSGIHSDYDLPFGMDFFRRWKCCSYFPASPTFKGFRAQKSKSTVQSLEEQ